MSHLVAGDNVTAGAESLKADWGWRWCLVPNRGPLGVLGKMCFCILGADTRNSDELWENQGFIGRRKAGVPLRSNELISWVGG